MDPSQKRLAVQTPDHPLGDAEFEGVLPAGAYGAGRVEIWDAGEYESVEPDDPVEGLENGLLTIRLHGRRLRGRFALVRMWGARGRHWLLVKI